MNHKAYLSLAIPLIFSAITTPLLGVADTAVVGHLSDASYLGGVAVGTLIFNTMYWLFGFLRVSTSGFAAQSLGADSLQKSLLVLLRPLLLAGIVGFLLIVFQQPLLQSALYIIGADPKVNELGAQYFLIRVWGAPFVLMSYALLGWLMGMSRIKAVIWIQFSANILNILLDLLFVQGFDFHVSGVAAASLTAEIYAVLAGLWVVKRHFHISILKAVKEKMDQIFDAKSMKKMLLVNRDLFLRTICLLVVFNVFTAKGASYGTETLAANAVLLQVHYLIAYFYDGFANASSIVTGKSIGQKNKQLFQSVIKLTYQWAIIASAASAVVIFAGKMYLYPLFTKIEEVLGTIHMYHEWLILYSLCAGFGVIFYGVFTGATETGYVRQSMVYAAAAFMAAYFALTGVFQNHGLWCSFIIFSLARSVFLMMYLPRLTKKLGFASEDQPPSFDSKTKSPKPL
ncbi:MATE family efflux transporter [Bacillus sp. SW14]|uniref:MATE family efflux transporter n=1 Tax=Bacillus sp. SW14 TaxID=3391618 RepID=UPI0039E5F1C6